MELQDFISQTLVAIAEGMRDASMRLKELDSPAVVNPMGFSRSMVMKGVGALYSDPPAGTAGQQCIDMIKFDVAVTATEGTQESGSMEKSGGGHIEVLSVFSVGGKAGSESSSSVNSSTSHMSRIQFNIPMYLPQDHRKIAKGMSANSQD